MGKDAFNVEDNCTGKVASSLVKLVENGVIETKIVQQKAP